MSKAKKNKRKRQIKTIIQLLILLILFSILVVMGLFYQKYGKTIINLQKEAKVLVRESDESIFKSAQTSLVYDIEGKLISTLKSEKEVYYLKFEDIPTPVIEAMVVTEDKKFLSHGGIDFLANIRAVLTLVKNKGNIKQGASTITQQLARNVFLTHAVTYERKIEELFVAQELERKYSKKKIMEFYLNNIYFANGYYGIQAASKGYFNKDVGKLSLSQMAFLCAIPNNPTVYNPRTNMDNTLIRRDRVLLQMLNDEKISEKEYKEAIKEEVKVKNKKKQKNNSVETYAYYSAIRALMANQGFVFKTNFKNDKEKELYDEEYTQLYHSCQQDLFVKGYRIYTSIDMDKQKILQESLDKSLEGFTTMNDEGIYELQGAAVSIDNETGKVVAIVGGRDQNLDGYTLNRAYQSYRQPGSAIKPLIVYAPAFELGYRPDSIVLDKKFKDGPKNSGGRYGGEIELKEAVERSTNTVAWKLYEEITPSVGLSYLLKMGFVKIVADDYYPATSLGGFTIGVSPLEMAAGFATLANDGYYREPNCIINITDSEGKKIAGTDPLPQHIYQSTATRLMTETLTGVIGSSIGTGRGLGLSNTISAGKTGTTDDKKDGWFVGYTPYYTTSVWVGYDLPKTLNDLWGSSYPGRIWQDYMNQIHDESMNDVFEIYEWKKEVGRDEPPEEEEVEDDLEDIDEEVIEDEIGDLEDDSNEDILDDEDEVIESDPEDEWDEEEDLDDDDFPVDEEFPDDFPEEFPDDLPDDFDQDDDLLPEIPDFEDDLPENEGDSLDEDNMLAG